MRNFNSFKLKLAVASVLALVATKYAKADLPVDERIARGCVVAGVHPGGTDWQGAHLGTGVEETDSF